MIYLFLNDALYKWVYSIFPISSPCFFQNKEMPCTSVIWCKVSIMTIFKTCCFNAISYAYLLYKNASIYHEIVELYCLVSHALNIVFMSWMTYFRLAVGLLIFDMFVWWTPDGINAFVSFWMFSICSLIMNHNTKDVSAWTHQTKVQKRLSLLVKTGFILYANCYSLWICFSYKPDLRTWCFIVEKQ